MKQVQRWCRHENEHVRRLSSEGIRPRLPWATHLAFFKRDPGLILPILEALKTDPSPYVRRSVANNLNDISKDHPELALKVARGWVKEGAFVVVRRGLRTLVKRGDPRALALANQRQKKASPAYWVYMIRTQKNKLYTGISTDPDRRLREHANLPKGAKYFRSDPALQLVWREIAFSRGQALKREAAIKRLSRADKEALLLRESRPDKYSRPRRPARGL